MAAMSLSGLYMGVGIIIGLILALKYTMWEIEHIPSNILSAGISLPSPPSAWKKSQPYLGWILLILILFMPVIYGKHVKLGILATITLLSGFVMHRARFCFARTFRDPFMTGESWPTQSVILSILVVVLGVSILKWLGIVPWYKYVFPIPIWSGIIGGIIFGFGMILAGGCGSGTLWRVGEGQIKLIAAMITMALSNALTKPWLWSKIIARKNVTFNYLPGHESLGWTGAFIIMIGVMLIWYLFVLWNEDSEKFVVI